MSGKAIHLSELIEEASRRVDPAGPVFTISALSNMPDPFFVDDADIVEQTALIEAYQADFGAIDKYRCLNRPLEAEDREVWIDRLAWLLVSLEAMKETRPAAPLFLAILQTAAAFKDFGPVWDMIPESYYTVNLLDRVSSIVADLRFVIDQNTPGIPIWEHEAVDCFLKAEAEENWSAIESSWRTIISAILPNSYVCQTVACLNATESGQQALAKALDKTESILSIAEAGSSMTPRQIAHVAVYSTSKKTRFGLVQSLSYNQPRGELLEEDTTNILASLFRTIQNDPGEWKKWMQAFNRYPVRTLCLQPALGASMIKSSPDIKSSYIKAIALHEYHGKCRKAVTICLSAFQEQASPDERKNMWYIAFRRWDEWNFGLSHAENCLTCMAVSDLDFALIGYFVECLSQSALSHELEVAYSALSNCLNTWHKDRGAYNTEWFRALSRWQIMIYASAVRNGEQPWELPKQYFLPFHSKSNRYAAMTYGNSLPLNMSDS